MGTAAICLELLADAISPRRKLLKELRAQWGKAGQKDGWLAGRYFELHAPQPATSQVDDKTWRDLEFPRIFAALDTTVTPLGSQYLFRQLHTYSHDVGIARLEAYHSLRLDTSLREKIQLLLARLRSESAARVVELIYGPLPAGFRFRSLLHLWSLICIVTVVGVLAFSAPLQLAAVALVTNLVITLTLPARIYQSLGALASCRALVLVADRLARLSTEKPITQLQELAAGRAARARVRRTLWVLNLLLADPVISRWLSFVCLVDLVVYSWALDRLKQLRSDLQATYDLVASLDAAIAVACMLERFPAHCAPQLTTQQVIEIEAGYHPLVLRPVTNSVALKGRSALVTGSNMAGKTTFIKMIGINIILGRALGVCLAARAILPVTEVKACIHGEHSVESGKSKYFAEMEAMLGFLRSARSGQSPVIIIDEPFSGTNTLERVAAAKAVLAALAAHAQVLASTHDTELQALLADGFDAYHFSETPVAEQLFDYRLRPGSCTEGNALRLLERMGFPHDVVTDALAHVAGHVPTDGGEAAHRPDGK